MLFKLKPRTGSHNETDSEGKVTTYKAADGYVFDTENDLCEMFPNKFERVEILSPEQIAAAPKVKLGGVAKAGAGKKDSKKTGKSARSKFGKDVTESYPSAGKDDLCVFQDGGGFTVVEANEPEKPLNSDNPLKKDQVEAFITKYLAT